MYKKILKKQNKKIHLQENKNKTKQTQNPRSVCNKTILKHCLGKQESSDYNMIVETKCSSTNWPLTVDWLTSHPITHPRPDTKQCLPWIYNFSSYFTHNCKETIWLLIQTVTELNIFVLKEWKLERSAY